MLASTVSAGGSVHGTVEYLGITLSFDLSIMDDIRDLCVMRVFRISRHTSSFLKSYLLWLLFCFGREG